jgi:hypothetical protein
MVGVSTKNLRSPNVLAKEIIAHHRTSVISTIKICQLFAEGWENYENGAWNNKEVASFLESIHQSGIGADPKNTILKEAVDGRFMIKSNSGTFSLMKSVGQHPIFYDEEVINICKVAGYSVLYAVTLFYNAVLDSYKDFKVGTRKANEKTIRLLSKGSELTREDVYKARDELVVAQSRAPKISTNKVIKNQSANYETLLRTGEVFGNLLLTLPNEMLVDIENSSYENLMENYSYINVREPESDVSILVEGSHLSTAMKLANVMSCNNPNVYCVTKSTQNDRIINISKEKILITSKNISQRKKVDKTNDLNNLIRTSVHNPKVTNLHLFADDAIDGWTSCIGVDASKK